MTVIFITLCAPAMAGAPHPRARGRQHSSPADPRAPPPDKDPEQPPSRAPNPHHGETEAKARQPPEPAEPPPGQGPTPGGIPGQHVSPHRTPVPPALPRTDRGKRQKPTARPGRRTPATSRDPGQSGGRTAVADLMTMRNQSARQTSAQTLPSQKPVLPQVRYHPSIQVPADAVLTKTASKGKTWTGKATARPLQTRTDTEDVKGQRVTRPAVRPDPGARQKPGEKTVPTDPVLSQKPGPADGSSAKTSSTVQTSQAFRSGTTSPRFQEDGNPTGPAVRPDPDGGQKPEEEPAPPTPEQLPLDSESQVDQDLVGQIEAWTCGQRLNKQWFTWRKNRITASVAHGIAHCRFVNGKSQTPPQSYLDAVTGEGSRVQTRAMSWGVHMEAEAVRRYQVLKSEALGHPVSVLDCGLYVDPGRSWLAASPDGIVTDSRTGRRLLVLEVKCPFKHRHRRVEDACREDPAFCLQLQPGHPPQYRLKTSHSYFTQIQCQLAVTGLQRADLVVFTLQETAVVPVQFHPELWQETVGKLELFYRSAVLPHIRLKKQHCAGPAARTEC